MSAFLHVCLPACLSACLYDCLPACLHACLVYFMGCDTDAALHSLPDRQFYLNQYDTTQAVVDAIGRIPYTGGSTYTHKALAFVRDTLFAQGYGRRPGVPKGILT